MKLKDIRLLLLTAALMLLVGCGGISDFDPLQGLAGPPCDNVPSYPYICRDFYPEEALQYGPLSIEYVNVGSDNKAASYINRGNEGNAQKFYAKAIELGSNHPAIPYNLGTNGMGDYGKAIKHFDDAIKMDPNHVPAHFNKGLVLQQLGDHKQAAQIYEEILKIDLEKEWEIRSVKPGLQNVPYDGHINNVLSRSTTPNLGEFKKKLYNRLGNAYRLSGEPEKAIESYELALATHDLNYDLNSDHAFNFAILTNRAFVYRMLGQHEKAIREYTALINRVGGSASHFFHRGESYFALGEYDKAISDKARSDELRKLNSPSSWEKGSR